MLKRTTTLWLLPLAVMLAAGCGRGAEPAQGEAAPGLEPAAAQAVSVDDDPAWLAYRGAQNEYMTDVTGMLEFVIAELRERWPGSETGNVDACDSLFRGGCFCLISVRRSLSAYRSRLQGGMDTDDRTRARGRWDGLTAQPPDVVRLRTAWEGLQSSREQWDVPEARISACPWGVLPPVWRP